jgi:hypothetical protein
MQDCACLTVKEVIGVTEVRNCVGKLVCCLDAANLIVEIVHKGIKTTIYIVPGGEPIIVNEAV